MIIQLLNTTDGNIYSAIKYDGRESTAVAIVDLMEEGELEYDDDGHYYGVLLYGKPIKRGELFLIIADGIVERYDFDADKSHLKQI